MTDFALAFIGFLLIAQFGVILAGSKSLKGAWADAAFQRYQAEHWESIAHHADEAAAFWCDAYDELKYQPEPVVEPSYGIMPDNELFAA